MRFPSAIAERLKPGIMARPEEAGRWTLYEPASDLTCRFSEHEPHGNELGITDLDNSGIAWNGRGLDLDRYHSAQAIRRHCDGREANLEINYVCRYACKHCFQDLAPGTVSEATPAPVELIAAARRLLDAGAREISITGGDIFLQPAVWDLLDFFQRVAPEVALRLLVNGGGLDLDDATTQMRLKVLADRRVLIKSDFFGHSSELHDGFTRVPGSFARLTRIFEFLRQENINCLATAALTRQNFDTRFELINFLYNLTGNRFTVSTIIYPTDNRRPETLADIRVTSEQFGELLEERFFSPLVAEYHSFEEQCAGDCQFTVASANGSVSGCSFLKRPDELLAVGRCTPLPLLESVMTWRDRARRLASAPECTECPASPTCRHCPSFLSAVGYANDYCSYSQKARPWLEARTRKAAESGFAFVHAADAGPAGLQGVAYVHAS